MTSDYMALVSELHAVATRELSEGHLFTSNRLTRSADALEDLLDAYDTDVTGWKRQLSEQATSTREEIERADRAEARIEEALRAGRLVLSNKSDVMHVLLGEESS